MFDYLYISDGYLLIMTYSNILVCYKFSEFQINNKCYTYRCFCDFLLFVLRLNRFYFLYLYLTIN